MIQGKSKIINRLIGVLLGALLTSGAVHAASTTMINSLITTGEQQANPAYGKQIKNLLIFQPAGWTGLGFAPYAGNTGLTWPQAGGLSAYLNRSSTIYLSQMAQIRDMSLNTAIAMLIMPDSEALAAGFITCFNGAINATDPNRCDSGQRTTPQQLTPHVKYAAWMKGIQVAPFFSINNYEGVPAGKTKGQYTLEKLTALTNWWMSQVDGATLKTTEGKVVILTESIDSGLAQGSAEQLAVINYMNSRTDILWIDNLANADNNPSLAAGNVIRSGATSDIAAQDWLKSLWGTRYRYHHLNRIATCKLLVQCSRSISDVQYIGETQRLKTLNISPYDPNGYPVVISQWNEYGEWLMYEPSLYDGSAEYSYLMWRLSQQP